MERKLTAFVLGGTGAVGKELIRALAADDRFEKVALIGRREIPLNPAEVPGHSKMENKLVDFDKLEEHKDVFKGYNVGFCSLGTTRQKAGSEAFYKVDHDYVVKAAKLAREGECGHFHLVSSTSANKNSPFLYPRTKGEVEDEITEMGFPRLSIYRPALLIVKESREDSRFGEAVFRAILGPLDRKRWFSIEVPLFARAMAENCFKEAPPSKTEIFTNAAIVTMSRSLNTSASPPGCCGKPNNATAPSS